MRILLILLFIATSVQCSAQFVLENWNEDNSPLLNNTVQALELDNDENLWIGTDYGLFKFDGENWTTFTTENSGIPSNQIRSITFNDQNELWVGTFDDGLAQFDGVNWTEFNIDNSDLPDNFVKYLKFDNNQSLWISTTGGLAKKSGNDWQIWDVYNADLWTNNMSYILVEESTNDKYVGSINGGLNIFKADTLHSIEMSYTHGIPDNTLYGMAFNDMNQLWIASPSGGLMIRYSSALWLWYNAENSDLPSSSYNDLKIGSNTYLASQDAGLVIFDGDAYTSLNTYNSNLGTDNISKLQLENNSSILWMGTTSHGLYRVNFETLNTVSKELENISIYPNPVSDRLTISGYTGKMGLHSLDGKLIDELEIVYIAHYDMSRLQSGMYLLKTEDKREYKLVKL